MSPADWIGLINGIMLLALTVKAFWGWVFGREHSEAVLAQRLTVVEARLQSLTTEIDDQSRQLQRHDTSIALLKDRSRRSS